MGQCTCKYIWRLFDENLDYWAGKVGYNLALALSKEKHDVTIIDNHYESLSKGRENLDVLCIKGNGVSTNVLMGSWYKRSRPLIAVTNSDEVNMVCCLLERSWVQ